MARPAGTMTDRRPPDWPSWVLIVAALAAVAWVAWEEFGWRMS